MKLAVLVGVAILIATPGWAQQTKPQPQPGGPAVFRPGCEWGICAQKLNGCKPLRGNTTSENYDAIARKVDACNRGRDSCQCDEKGQ
jgi:hypothetical protein